MRKTFKRFLKSVGGSNCDCGWSVHILESSKVPKQYKISTVSSSTEIVESKDKGFVRFLQTSLYYSRLIFEKVSPPVFYCETSLFH